MYWILLAQDRVQIVCKHGEETTRDIIQGNVRSSWATIVCCQGSEISSPHSFVIEGSVCVCVTLVSQLIYECSHEK